MAGADRNPSAPNQLKRLTWVHNGRKMEACFLVGSGHPIRVPCQAPLAGLGDVVAGATKAVGIQPCARCKRTQEQLNRLTPGWVRKGLSALGLRAPRRQPDHHVKDQGKRQDGQAPHEQHDA